MHIVKRSDNNSEEIINRKICKERLSCIRLAPDSLSVAAASHDGGVYIFANLPKDDGTLVWEFTGKLKGHSSAVNTLDFSQQKLDGCGYLLRSSSTSLDVKFWHPATLEEFDKKKIPDNTSWFTQSILVDVSTIGIMTSRFSKEADVTSVDVNNTNTLAVCGDSAGNIGLFQYPCSHAGTYCHSYRGHAFVHSVRFTSYGKFVMTVGGRDSCLMQWETV